MNVVHHVHCRFIEEACISPFSDEAVIKSIPLASFPPDMYMVVRALMLLRGLCFSLNLDYNVRLLPVFVGLLVTTAWSPC